MKMGANYYHIDNLFSVGEIEGDGGSQPPTGTGGYKNPGTVKGPQYTFGSIQIGYAIRIAQECDKAPGGNNDLVKIACFMCAIVESAIWMYANTNVPQSMSIPHNRVGNDHASVGIYQQQVSPNIFGTGPFGWGTIQQCMNVEASTRSFLGILEGAPTYGLLKLDPPYNQRPTLGAAVQRVQVSAFPDRYDAVRPDAEALLRAIKR